MSDHHSELEESLDILIEEMREANSWWRHRSLLQMLVYPIEQLLETITQRLPAPSNPYQTDDDNIYCSLERRKDHKLRKLLDDFKFQFNAVRMHKTRIITRISDDEVA